MNKKILLLLGASSDVGISLIKTVYDEYDTIIAHYNSSKNELEILKSELGNKIKICNSNFLSEKSIDEFLDEMESKYGYPTHIVHLPALKVVNNRFHKTNWECFENNINTQLRSIYKILSRILPQMSKVKYGKIVFMLTSFTVSNPPKFCSEYVTVKYALLGLMKSLAVEYADKFINVNAVSPSMIETKFIENLHEIAIEQSAASNPMKRNANVNDVVPLIKFLLSDESRYITGQNIVISGGSTM